MITVKYSLFLNEVKIYELFRIKSLSPGSGASMGRGRPFPERYDKGLFRLHSRSDREPRIPSDVVLQGGRCGGQIYRKNKPSSGKYAEKLRERTKKRT